MDAFSARRLSVLAYANGFTLWHYKAVDRAAFESGFFEDAAEFLRPGDLIQVTSPNDYRTIHVGEELLRGRDRV